MSIIHDALKKVQQGQAPKSDKTPTDPATPDPAAPGYIYANAAGPAKQEDERPVEHLASQPNKARSVLAFLCALAITLGAFVFLYKQICTSFPQLKNWAKTSFNKLTHKKELPDFKTRTPEDLKPLAKITVNPPKPLNPPKPIPAQGPTSMLVTSNTDLPVTLNIHGVMSNGPSNLVLINDQVYQEGDDVDGVKIVKINLNTITVINNGKEETIVVKN